MEIKMEFQSVAVACLSAAVLMIVAPVWAESFDPMALWKQAGDALNAAGQFGNDVMRNFDPQKDNLIIDSKVFNADNRVTKFQAHHCSSLGIDPNKMDNIRIVIDNGQISITDKSLKKEVLKKPVSRNFQGFDCS